MSRSYISTPITDIKHYAKTLGFARFGITKPVTTLYQEKITTGLQKEHTVGMPYVQKHIEKRLDPRKLLPNTKSIICVALSYTENISDSTAIANYARGTDYHLIVRERLEQLANYIKTKIPRFNYKIFVDTAPVLEKSLAEQAGIGWIGKNTLITHKNMGSWMVLGEIFTDVELPFDASAKNYCGDCTKCLEACPTQALISENQLDTRRCIAYLTIEHRGSIPTELRSHIGQRIFGCDACQTLCPWNTKISKTNTGIFNPRKEFTTTDLIILFLWDEKTFHKKTENSPIQRIGHERWLRNIAIALGNSPYNQEIINVLRQNLTHPSELVREHIIWALDSLKANIS